MSFFTQVRQALKDPYCRAASWTGGIGYGSYKIYWYEQDTPKWFSERPDLSRWFGFLVPSSLGGTGLNTTPQAERFFRSDQDGTEDIASVRLVWNNAIVPEKQHLRAPGA